MLAKFLTNLKHHTDDRNISSSEFANMLLTWSVDETAGEEKFIFTNPCLKFSH